MACERSLRNHGKGSRITPACRLHYEIQQIEGRRNCLLQARWPMSRFRELKARFAAVCASPDWLRLLESLLPEGAAFKEAVNPLLALLPRPECRLKAAYGLGLAVSRLARVEMESARVIMRRLMWSMNEESGNLGWGVPEAMGAIVSMSPALAREYARVFLSYGYETGRDDNFLDHAPLRCGVYTGAAMLASADFAAARPLLPYLSRALAEPEASIRASAALLLLRLARAAPAGDFSGPGRADWEQALDTARASASLSGGDTSIEYIIEEGSIVSATAGDLFAQAVQAVEQGLVS